MIRAFAAVALAAAIAPSFAEGQTAPAPTTAQPACAAPEHRQFDFWVGRWDVYPRGKDTLVAHSLIESLYGGCGVRENWMPLKGSGGGSLNIYLPAEKAWRQTWIDSSGARVDFKGALQGRAMVMEGLWNGVVTPGKDGLVRMTYSPEPGGVVRQHGEVSEDGGRTWKDSFDFDYRPAR